MCLSYINDMIYAMYRELAEITRRRSEQLNYAKLFASFATAAEKSKSLTVNEELLPNLNQRPHTC